MSRDYRESRRSRSRSRDASHNRRHDDVSRKELNEIGDVTGSWAEKLRTSRTTSVTSGKALDDALAAELGYNADGWHRPSTIASMSSWGISTNAPPPPPAQPAVSEAERWGYTPKPYVPPSMPMPSMPLLANPMAVHHMSHPPPPMPPPVEGAHLVLENIPGELNMMSLLYEHFKQFGEVVAIHCIPKYNKALVDFRTRDIAETAASQPVLGVPIIRVSVFQGPARGGPARQPPPRPIGTNGPSPSPQPSTPAPTGLTKNLVLESEAAKRTRERREKQGEADRKRVELLETCTAHVKQIVAKLADKSLPEESRAQYTKMLDSVKAKISELQKVDNEKRRKEAEAYQKALTLRYKAYEKQARVDSSRRQQELTLDLRSRCVKISQLPEELAQSVVLVEYLRAMGMKDLDDVVWLGVLRDAAVLRFQSHGAADALVKHELAFKAEWVSNEEAASLANLNPVEQVEILPLEDEPEDP